MNSRLTKFLRTILLAVLGLGVINFAFFACMPYERALALGWFDDWKCRDLRGFVSRIFVDGEGKAHKYVVFVPFGLDEGAQRSERPPLMLFLHGFTPSGDDGINQLRECLGPAIWERKRTFPFVVVFPQCPAGGSWDASKKPARLALAMLEKTASEYGTDPERVYLTGVSTGGDGAWSIAAREPKPFAAVVPVSGIPDASTAKGLAEARLPIWNFYVRGDDEHLVKANRRMHEELVAAGAGPGWTEFDGTLSKTWWKHNAWGHAYRNSAVYEWLLKQTRSGNVSGTQPVPNPGVAATDAVSAKESQSLPDGPSPPTPLPDNSVRHGN